MRAEKVVATVARMKRWSVWAAAAAVLLMAFPLQLPAPLVFRPGEGWTYEPVGEEGKWRRPTAKEQLAVAQEAFDRKDYGLALRASRYLVRQFPDSDYVPQARYLIGRCQEATRRDEKAFRTYQTLLEKNPKLDNHEEVLARQYAIANRFLEGQRSRLWGVIPLYRSMLRAAEMFETVVKNGPYSPVGPSAQLNVGRAYEKRHRYPEAVRAYEKAGDRYFDRQEVAAEALFRAGLAYQKQAKRAEYDQTAAGYALDTLGDFVDLYPNDPRVPEAKKIIADLRREQARGSFNIARFYEKKKRPQSAAIYYSEVLLLDPASSFAEEAQRRIAAIKACSPSSTP